MSGTRMGGHAGPRALDGWGWSPRSTARSALVVALGVLLPGCRPSVPQAVATRVQVVVSVPPQAWMVERLAGNLVDIEVLIPPGVSPAAHEPTISQLTAMSRAALYVKVGHPHFPFEKSWLDRLLDDRKDLVVVDSSAGIESDEHDPHSWVAPAHVRVMMRNIADALAELLPEADIEARHAAAIAEVDAADEEIRRLFVGKRGGRFFVHHPAWGALAEQYGLQQVAIEQDGKQPDAYAVARLIADAREAGVEVVFVSPQVDPSAARVVADAIGASIEVLDPLARDWSVNMRRVALRLSEAIVP